MVAAQVPGVEALPRQGGGVRPRHSVGGSGSGGGELVTETVLVTVSYGPSTTVTLGAGDAMSDGSSDEREWRSILY
jgi:hypothetical protein